MFWSVFFLYLMSRHVGDLALIFLVTGVWSGTFARPWVARLVVVVGVVTVGSVGAGHVVTGAGAAGAGVGVGSAGSALLDNNLLLLLFGAELRGHWALGSWSLVHSATLFRDPLSTLSMVALVHSMLGLFNPGWTDLAASPPSTDITGTLGAPHSMHLFRFFGPGICFAIMMDSLAAL